MKLFQADEGMNPDDAKTKALEMFELWLCCRKSEIIKLGISLDKKRARIRRIASANIHNCVFRWCLKRVDAALSISAKWTVRSIRKAQARKSDITQAILELNTDIPEKAIYLLADTMSHMMAMSPAKGSTSDIAFDNSLADSSIALFFGSIIQGLRGLKAEKSEAPSA